MATVRLKVVEPFRDAAQQREADFLGMWLFLASELLLFGVIFMAACYYRVALPAGVREASRHLELWIGTVNSAVLITSSMTMALAVHCARRGRHDRLVLCLWLTFTLGLVFMGFKAYEYGEDYRRGLWPGGGPAFPLHEAGSELFVNLYWIATALHGLHLSIGMGLLGGLALFSAAGRFHFPERQIVVEMCGLYWTLVDLIWIFLFPLLYLVR